MKTFPTLYQRTQTGAIQQWRIWVEEHATPEKGGPFGEICTEHGQVGGKLQVGSDLVTNGKNPGKANETSAYEQAAREARAKWTKQKKKGYVESLADAEAGKVDETVITGGIEPMLAPSDIYPKFKKDIQFPCYVQPKFDGNRCIAVVKDGKCTLWTRTRKPINSVPHIVAAIEKACHSFEYMVLDGELYNHDYRDNFEDLMSLIRPPAPVPGHEVVQYHVYDIARAKVSLNFGDRHRDLNMLFTEFPKDGPIKEVRTAIVKGDGDIWDEHNRNLAEEYEGTMIRNDGPYEEGRRSRHLQKLKTWKDSEYQIIGYAEGRGKDAGTVGAFYCAISEGYLPEAWAEICENLAAGRPELRGFKARLKASYDYRRKLFAAKDFVGKQLTVKYQNLTGDGKPRFPIGKAIRDYE